MELNELTRGEYTAPDTDPGTELRNRIFISKKTMTLLVIAAVFLLIISAVMGTVLSPGHSSNTNEDKSPSLINRTRKKVDQANQLPRNGPWKNFRLPETIKPLHYDVIIRVNMSRSKYHGLVRIRFSVKVETRFVLLHTAGRMAFKKLDIQDMNKRQVTKGERVWQYDSFLVIQTDEKLKRGLTYTVAVQYETDFLNYPYKGLFWLPNRRVYNPKTGVYKTRKKMAVTFLAPASARRNFPCFDEPALKATFTLTLIYNRGFTSLSNMPVGARRTTKTMVYERFQKSLIMPTYMLNYVIFDYSSSTTTSVNGTRLSLWSPRHTAGERGYALHVANITLPFYESLFDMKYSLPKLDMTTVPTYPVMAMENWGLINYVQSNVLVKEDSNSNSVVMQKQSVALLVAHEIVHQWFGNLATIRWWDDLLIHEGCATYLQYFGAAYSEPSLDLMNQFYNIDVRLAMAEDSLNSSHAISRDVTSTGAIWANVNLLMYRKGAAILRMLHKFIGDKEFFGGLRLFLKRFAFKSAGQDDLWDAISETSKMDVKSLMRPWTKQPGFPVITTSREISNGDITITQKRFLTGDRRTENIDALSWKVPITYTTARDPKKSKFLLLSSRTARLPIKNEAWFKLNSNADGYFIVNYDAKNWNSLSQQLQKDPSVFSILDRSSLIKDVFTLAEEGIVTYDTAFDMTLYLRKESDWIPWQYVKLYISSIITRLPTKSKTRQMLLQYYGKMTRSLLQKYGWNEIKEPGLKARFLQETAITAALNANNKDTTDIAKRLFRNWMTNHTRINPNIAGVVYFYGVRNGGQVEWNRVYQAYTFQRKGDEKKALKNALACSTVSRTLKKLLDQSLRSRYHNIVNTLKIVADSSTTGRYTAWSFIQRNWERLPASVSFDYAMLAYIKPVTEKFSTLYYYNSVYQFVNKKFRFKMTDVKVKELLSSIRGNIHWAKTSIPEINKWLGKH